MALNSIEKLRIWCQKVLPLVYDDSLSYYEVLTKVVNKLNEVIALAQEQNETIEEALSDIETFETDMSAQFESYKTTLNAALDAFESEITAHQSAFEGRMTQAFADFLADYEREFGITNLYGDSTTLAISQNQVSKLLDYTTNNNRFNPEVITSGKAIDNTGALIDNPNTAVTGYIEVQPGENIVAQAKNNTTNERYQGAGTGTDVPLVFDSIAGYDEELNFVSGSFKSLVFNYQVPVGVKYIKLAMGQTILDGTNTDMSELAIVNSDGTIYPYQPYSEQNATVKMNALPVDDTTVGNHLWTANKINEFQAAVQGEIQQLETDLTGTVQGAIGDMNANFTQKSAELDTKFDTLEGSIRTEQEAFETEIEGALASQKTELEAEIAEVASDVQTLSDSVATQGQAISNLTGIVTSIDGRVDTLETDMTAAKQDITDLEASDTQQSTDITNLKDRMTTAEGNIDTLETASEEHTTAISNLQAKDAELVSDINGLSTRVGAAEGDINLLEGRADTLETDVDNLKTDVAELEEKKADRVGYEKDLNVGGAVMLIGNGTISDNKAYNFRRTADGNQNVGNRLTDKIIGGTLVVNQKLRELSETYWSAPNASATFANGIATFTSNIAYSGGLRSSNSPFDIIANHKYLVLVSAKAAGNTTIRVNFLQAAHAIDKTVEANKWETISGIYRSETDYTNNEIVIYNYVESDFVEIQVKNVMFIDITQLFGSSTIADYVYNLEQTTVGSGIAWLYEYFPILNGGYIPYTPARLQSIVLSKHILTGFNKWDEEWEIGAISNGADTPFINGIRSVGYMKCLPNTEYYGTVKTANNCFIWWYDINKNYISNTTFNNSKFRSPVNAYFFRISGTSTYGKKYQNDICINFSGERNGEYEPYNGHEYTLDSSKELRGVPQIDSNGKLYFDGDRYKDGVMRRFVLVAMDMLSWSKWDDDSNTFAVPLTVKSRNSQNIICSNYLALINNSDNWLAVKSYKKIIYAPLDTQYILVRDTSFGDVTSFKASLTGHYLICELATPTTESATPIPNPQICSPDGTEEYIDPRVEAGTIPFAIPTGHETIYNTSLDFKLNQIPALPTAAGVYKLQITVSSGVPSYSWVAEV